MPEYTGGCTIRGMPIPDSDGDGVNDEVDKCPKEAGPASNDGCPVKVVSEAMRQEVSMAAKNIFFLTGKASLLKKSYPALSDVVKLLKENEAVKLQIEGHTDNVGTAKVNDALSQNGQTQY